MIVAPVRFARVRSASDRSASMICAPLRLASVRFGSAQVPSLEVRCRTAFALERSASSRSAPERSTFGHGVDGSMTQPFTVSSAESDPPQPASTVAARRQSAIRAGESHVVLLLVGLDRPGIMTGRARGCRDDRRARAVTFLVDVDDTLLDNDRIRPDVQAHLVRHVRRGRRGALLDDPGAPVRRARLPRLPRRRAGVVGGRRRRSAPARGVAATSSAIRLPTGSTTGRSTSSHICARSGRRSSSPTETPSSSPTRSRRPGLRRRSTGTSSSTSTRSSRSTTSSAATRPIATSSSTTSCGSSPRRRSSGASG